MPKKLKGASTKQIDYIKKRSSEGASANRIQKEMQARHMGMKRQRLLKYVREYKGQHKKAEPSKYTPKKYRRLIKRKIHYEIGKAVAVYGSVDGESKRVQMKGSGRNLYKAMMQVSKHPPKKKFLTASAEDIARNPYRYLDMDEEWDIHPEVTSR
jgi:hypothetical protein